LCEINNKIFSSMQHNLNKPITQQNKSKKSYQPILDQ